MSVGSQTRDAVAKVAIEVFFEGPLQSAKLLLHEQSAIDAAVELGWIDRFEHPEYGTTYHARRGGGQDIPAERPPEVADLQREIERLETELYSWKAKLSAVLSQDPVPVGWARGILADVCNSGIGTSYPEASGDLERMAADFRRSHE